MNPLFVSDEGFESAARDSRLSAPLGGRSRERFAREAQEKRPRPEVESRLHAIPWLVLLILALLTLFAVTYFMLYAVAHVDLWHMLHSTAILYGH